MDTRFIFVRHAKCAQSDEVLFGRAVDAPLDAYGERQVGAVAAHLRAVRPTLVEASPRRRAQQTARAIAAASACELRTCDALDEIDFGAWSGRRFAELEHDPHWRRWNTRRSTACTPAGVRIADVQARVVAHLRELAARFAGATLVLVTHAEIVRAVVLHALGRTPDEYMRVRVDPASLTVLHGSTDGLRVDLVNARAGA
ncbi:MAG TPA: histidine phosphatase family protein [Dokdonella sp.]